MDVMAKGIYLFSVASILGEATGVRTHGPVRRGDNPIKESLVNIHGHILSYPH